MLNELKAAHLAAYVAAAALVVAFFVSVLKPLLLNSPPSALMLPVVAILTATMFYVLSTGPRWALQFAGPVRYQFSHATLALALFVAGCATMPIMPATAAYMLHAIAGDSRPRPAPSRAIG